jgi:hypothetical protein
MQNVQVLLQNHTGRLPVSNLNLSTNLPLWRVQHIRPHLGIIVTNLDVIDRALGMLSVDASLPGPLGIELVALRRLATELRAEATETQQMLDRQQGDASSDQTPLSTAGASTSAVSSPPPIAPGAPIMTPAVPTTSQPQSQNATQTMPADAPAELFLLSSPQGPVGILFDQQGTYTTAPMVSTLPFQTFTNQFAQNRQLIAGLGQQMAQSAHQLHNQEIHTRGNEAQQPAAGGQVQDQHQAQDQDQTQNQNQNHQAPANAPENPAAEPDRVVNVGAHLWLIFKLACFVYFFSGGSGYYRPVVLGLIACIVYLAQIGIFEDQINVLRRHFEALLPTGAWAAAPNNNNANGNGNAAANRHNLTPEEAARWLMEQRRVGNGANNGNGAFGMLREGMRSVERAFALFVASLFPGVGERMVHAQEERERLERVRLREEEETERQRVEREREQEREKVEQQEWEKKNGPGGAGEGETSGKGKEKAEHTEGEGEGEGEGSA